MSDIGSESSGQVGLVQQLSDAAKAHGLGDDRLLLTTELMRFAWTMSDRDQRAFAFLVLSLLIAARGGSTRLPLGGGHKGYLAGVLRSLLEHVDCDCTVRTLLSDIKQLCTKMTFDRLIGGPGEFRPIIVEHGVEDDYVYQHQTFVCEKRLIKSFQSRFDADDSHLPDEQAVRAAVCAIVRSGRIDVSQQQQDAVIAALSRSVCVITGGPGTGKTSTVAALLLVLDRLGVPADTNTDAVAIVGPTGKSVNRLQEALAKRGIIRRCHTLHRLLGASGRGRFFHNENNPVTAAVLIVDETSMVDLTLMNRLVRSLRPQSQLILVGDADQLPSVDAGSVLRDLVQVGEPSAGREGKIPFVTRLSQTFRARDTDASGVAILDAARQVRAGVVPTLHPKGTMLRVRKPADLTGHGVEWLDTTRKPEGAAFFLDYWFETNIEGNIERKRLSEKVYQFRDGSFAEQDKQDLEQLLLLLDRQRLLTVTRNYNFGSDAVNQRIHARVIAGTSISGTPDYYPGEPIVATRNDYRRDLYNGDSGVIVRVAQYDQSHQFRAVFPCHGSFSVFPIDAVRSSVQLAHAMTVHRSQGSEFDAVAIFLPRVDVAILTQELLYTAITRAKRSVTLIGSATLLRKGCARMSQRFSGLAEGLGRR